MKVRSHLEDVDQLISKVKLVTVKNKIRRAKFATIGRSLQPVVTRWRSWLNNFLYYAKILPEMKAIVESFEGSGISISQAKS